MHFNLQVVNTIYCYLCSHVLVQFVSKILVWQLKTCSWVERNVETTPLIVCYDLGKTVEIYVYTTHYVL